MVASSLAGMSGGKFAMSYATLPSERIALLTLGAASSDRYYPLIAREKCSVGATNPC